MNHIPVEIIRDRGLEPYVPPKPLPEITPDDVYLVCWLALSDGDAVAKAGEPYIRP